MTLDVERYSVGRAASVTYGPLGAEPEPWTLRFATEGGERVVVRLDREAMYELWTEVRGVPWPTVHRDRSAARKTNSSGNLWSERTSRTPRSSARRWTRWEVRNGESRLARRVGPDTAPSARA